MNPAQQRITLAQLQAVIGSIIEEGLPGAVWTSAEIAGINLNRSGHCYLELVENSPSGTPLAQARGIIWRTNYPVLAAKFERESGSRLTAGMKILVLASVSHHPVYGLALTITDIDPSFTLGDMERRKQQTIARLQSEGLWDANRRLPLPLAVQRVAVVSSASAAGWRDFCKELGRSPYRFRTELFEATMQGESSETSIAAAMERIAARATDFDAVAIIRGGGSTADLDCYNSYGVAAAVARSPLAVITGVGHDKDVSAADMVAAVPLKTPTAVAVWLHERAAGLDGRIEYDALLLRDLALGAVQAAALRLQSSGERLRTAVAARLSAEGERMRQAAGGLRVAAAAALQSEARRIEAWSALTENYAPQRIVELGFAVARSEGATLRSIGQVRRGQSIEVELADGTLTATVTGRRAGNTVLQPE